MRFWEWVNERDHGVLRKVSNASRINYAQLYEYYCERRIPRDYATAELISVATGGEVTVREIMTPRKGKKPPKRVSKRATEAAARAKPTRKRRSTSSEARA